MTELERYFCNNADAQKQFINLALLPGLNCKNCPANEYCDSNQCYCDNIHDTCAEIIQEWGEQIFQDVDRHFNWGFLDEEKQDEITPITTQEPSQEICDSQSEHRKFVVNMAKKGYPIMTKSGLSARIVANDCMIDGREHMLVLLTSNQNGKIVETPHTYDENGQLWNYGSTSFDLVLKNVDDYVLNADTFKFLGFDDITDHTFENTTFETFEKIYPDYTCMLNSDTEKDGWDCRITNGISYINLITRTVKDVKTACNFFQQYYLNSNNYNQ